MDIRPALVTVVVIDVATASKTIPLERPLTVVVVPCAVTDIPVAAPTKETRGLVPLVCPRIVAEIMATPTALDVVPTCRTLPLRGCATPPAVMVNPTVLAD